MDPFAQAHLSELLAAARLGPPVPSVEPDEHNSRSLMTFSAAIAALKGVGAISDQDIADWTNRMLVALGEEPLDPLPQIAGVSRARLINFGGTPPPRLPDPPPLSRFIALVPVDEPDRPLAYGGRIQILGVEIYSDKVAVNWRLAPIPDYEAVFAAELAEQEPDLEGLSHDFKKILREKLVQRLQMRKRFISLVDEAGTPYRPMGGGSGSGGNERRGHSDFAPGVPATGRRLTVRWDEMDFNVQLPARHDSA
jgi:hypothetical protein